MAYGIALYVMVWHSMAWFGCIDHRYTLLLRFTFWGASLKSDYLVFKNTNQVQSEMSVLRNRLTVAESRNTLLEQVFLKEIALFWRFDQSDFLTGERGPF